MYKLLAALFVVSLVSFAGWAEKRISQAIVFDREIGGYLKRAADSNTVDLAIKNLATAHARATLDGMTTGYTTALFWTHPKEDVGFWYDNLSASLKELEDIPAGATLLERSNVLLKLRQTLLDHTGSGGEQVTEPPGISVFPLNRATALWGLLNALGLALPAGAAAALSYGRSWDFSFL